MKSITKIGLLVLINTFLINTIYSQACYPILNCFNMKDTLINTCTGTFKDSDAGGLTTGLYAYGNNENYTATFCSGSSNKIIFTFTTLNIKSGDFLRIYDGPNTSSPLLYTISNQNIPSLVVFSSGTCLTFHFTSDNSGSTFSPNGNWEATISCASTIHTINNPTQVSECGAYFVDEGLNGNYNNNSNYVKTFCPSGSYNCLSVEFLMVDIENNADFLYIYDGTTTNGPLLATVTGTSGAMAQSSGALHCLTFKFTSNGTTTKPGWLAKINCSNFCPPPCNPNPGAYAADACANAPQICDLNGYCGNTSGAFTPDLPGNMCQSCNTLFQGTIENNSWLMFLASDVSASFNVYVGGCSSGSGIQMGIYGATNCNNFTLMSDINLTSTSGISSGNMFTITANNLTPGNTYYIMVDGVGGSVCNYTVEAASGVLLGVTITAPLSICEGQSANLSVTPGATSYSWTASPPDPSLAGQSGNSTIHVTPTQTTTYTCHIVAGPSSCASDTTLTTMVTVYAATDPQCSADYECQITATANPIVICRGDTVRISATGHITRDVLANDFNTQTAGVGWANTASAQFNNPCGPGPDSWYLWMGPQADVPRILESNDFDLSAGGIIMFYLRYAIQGQNSPCEGPDEPDEGVSLQYSTNHGASWVDFKYFHPNGNILTSNPGGNSPTVTGNTPFTVWKQYTFTIPPGAQTTSTRWRWYQSASSTAPYDHWGLDSILITTPPPNVVINWSSNPVDPTLSTANNATQQTVSPTTTTLYTATISTVINGIPYSCRDTVWVNVNPIPNVTVPPAYMCNGNCTTMVASGANTYTWAASTSGLSSTTGSSVNACFTQNATVTVTGTAAGCKDTAVTTVTIYPNPQVQVTPNSGTICVYNSLQLNATGADSAYVWAGNNISPTTGSQVTVNPTQTTTYTVTGTNIYGCKNTATVAVTVNPLPVVTITSPDDSLCVGESTTLTANGASTYEWAGANITPSTTSNPITVNPTVTFVYSVTGTATTGCQNDTAFMVVVSPNPVVTVNLSDTAICLGEHVNVNGNGSHYYTWSNGLNPSTGAATQFSPSAVGSYTFTVTGTNNTGCKDNEVFTIVVYPNPQVYITPLYPEACSGQPVTVYAHGADFYQWSQGGNPSNLDSCIYYPTSSVIVTVTGTTIHGCSGTASVQILIKPSPVISFTPYPMNGCQPLTVNFNYAANPGDICNWNFGDNTTSNLPAPTHVYNTPGSYNVTLTVTTGEGCVGSHTETGLITVYPMPVANFIMQDSVVYMGTNVQMASTSANASTFNWNFGEPSSGSANFAFTNNVEHLYNIPGTYDVTLIVTSTSDECIDSITKTIRVVDIQTTNIITPNGDGKNDSFILPNVDLVENSHLIVYNRWGRKMYEDYNYKNDWVPQGVADGVYFWVLTMPNGVWFVGNVTIINSGN